MPVDYHRKERFAGQSKYPLGKMLLLAADALTGFGTAPLRSLYILGLAAVLGSLLLIIWSVVQYFRFNVVPGWSSLMVVFLTISSIQLVSLAFIGEYVGRIFEQSKNRPLFVIRDVIVSERRRSGGCRPTIRGDAGAAPPPHRWKVRFGLSSPASPSTSATSLP